MPAGGGPGSVDVAADATCAWRPRSDDSWIAVTSASVVFGNATVTFTVAANDGPGRAGAIRAAGRAFAINQENGCTYGVAPAAHPFSAAGGVGTFNITTSASTCPWTAVPDALWITISGSATGTGAGPVSFSVQPNTTGVARSGTINVQGQLVTISQAAQ